MTYSEEKRDLFTVSKEYHLAHCIASDLGMGAGIAVQFQKRFNIRGKIVSSGEPLKHPTCILTGRIFNLITKSKSSGKPTYVSLVASLLKMQRIADESGIHKIAVPRIGCGLDKLSWPIVREHVKSLFDSNDIEILVCYI